ncbi:MAG: hypothetical protein ABSH22_14660 [Tepidisphaeraceae bacterium]|jgi:hypothetical protein
MPPVNPQGTRGGLVAAVVVFTVLFVASTIFAIYYGVQFGKDEDSLKDLTTRYRDIAQDINNSDVQNLRTLARTDTKLPEPTALAEAMRQRDDLRRLIGGNLSSSATDTSAPGDISDTLARAQKVVGQAKTLMATTGAGFSAESSLLDVIGALSTTVDNLNKAVATAKGDSTAARAQATKDSQAASDAQAKADAAVNAAKEALQQQVDAANDAVKKAEDDSGSVKKTFEDEQRSTAAALDAADKKQVELVNEIDGLNKQISSLRNRLAGRRIAVEDAIIRRPEGAVVDIADATTVYINLGKGDQIVPGMTFEVYDKNLPLPKLGEGQSETDLPAGKASLEVTRVGDTSSECHVNQITPGEQIVQGDRILNLIYDRNTKFNFYVFGDFDVSRSGHPSAAGADVIRRLITQWGGHVDPKLDVETDFVVVGSPPDVPVYSADELKDPLNEQNLANAKRAADDYDNVVATAENLHVPIMNQNKFLYFTGYYDLALR